MRVIQNFSAPSCQKCKSPKEMKAWNRRREGGACKFPHLVLSPAVRYFEQPAAVARIKRHPQGAEGFGVAPN